MLINSSSQLKKSFLYAFRGLRYTFKYEQNFRIQLFFSVLVIIFMIIISVKPWEAVALMFVIISVLSLEILNTCMERIIDILKPRLHHYNEIVKDMMAAAVFLASFGALVVGLIIFLPYLLIIFT